MPFAKDALRMLGRVPRKDTAFVVAALGLIAALLLWPRPASSPARRVTLTQVAAPTPDEPPVRRRFPARAEAPRPIEGQGTWWAGPMGIVLALAALGWAGVAARRYLPATAAAAPGAVRVVGRASLSPKHAVHLVDVGGRVLIVGTGPQGAPALLGELAAGDDL